MLFDLVRQTTQLRMRGATHHTTRTIADAGALDLFADLSGSNDSQAAQAAAEAAGEAAPLGSAPGESLPIHSIVICTGGGAAAAAHAPEIFFKLFLRIDFCCEAVQGPPLAHTRHLWPTHFTAA